jgi:8-amino-7-oxononanoate synthase
MRAPSTLRARGFDVRGVRPPAVAQGTARLRVSVTINMDERDISSLIDAPAQELRVIEA